MEIHHLKIKNERGELENITLELSREGYNCCLTANSIITGKLTFSEYDYWECLTKLRLILEAKGYLILCRGAKKNIVLSGMCRDMGSGLKGYEVKLGRKSSMSHLVSVFEPIENDAVTIEEQEQFKKKWLLLPKI